MSRKAVRVLLIVSFRQEHSRVCAAPDAQSCEHTALLGKRGRETRRRLRRRRASLVGIISFNKHECSFCSQLYQRVEAINIPASNFRCSRLPLLAEQLKACSSLRSRGHEARATEPRQSADAITLGQGEPDSKPHLLPVRPVCRAIRDGPKKCSALIGRRRLRGAGRGNSVAITSSIPISIRRRSFDFEAGVFNANFASLDARRRRFESQRND